MVQMVKNLPAMQETCVQSLGQEDPLEKGRAPNPAFLPEEFQERWRLAGNDSWGLKESDMIKD